MTSPHGTHANEVHTGQMVNPTPAAELEIDEALVRRLLAEQVPEHADLSLQLLASGWDNTIMALGDDLLVRLPHRAASVDLVRYEQRWLPLLAPRLPVTIPVPVFAGSPSDGFPWPWSIVGRVDGLDAISAPFDAAGAVDVLAGFFAAMHVPAPDDAPINPWRGGPLSERAAVTLQRFEGLTSWLDGRVDADRLRALWSRAFEAEPYEATPLWIHGDMHPGNVIVRGGRIVSVIDFGDLTSGDRATDLGSAWMLLDEDHRSELRDRLSVDDATWERARGWALSVALAIAENSANNPRYEAMAMRTLARVAADAT